MEGAERKVPERIVIFCEGKTEVEYFKIIRDVWRVNLVGRNDIRRKSQQGKALIDTAVLEIQKEVNENLDIYTSLDDIEVWAVCDQDKCATSYPDLQKHADDNGINLAYVNPQFEHYLMQHFGGPRTFTGRGNKAKQEINDLAKEAYGLELQYDKADLSWLRLLIEEKQSIVKTAIVNADNYSKTRSRLPFMTTQELTKRMLELANLYNFPL